MPGDSGLSVVVSDDRFVLALYHASTRMYRKVRKHFRMVPTLAEALRLIQDSRSDDDNKRARISTLELFIGSRTGEI
jgi:hypothetical protein